MAQTKSVFKEVKQPQRISRLIENQIKQAIFENHYKVGDKIPQEQELAEMFNASRSSVREALRALERSGFIEIRKGVRGGAFVTRSVVKHVVETMADMFEFSNISHEDILQARLTIEPSLAAEAAKKATPEDIERLREANRALRDGYKSGDPARENVPTSHRVIAKISGNKIMCMVMDVLMDVFTMRISAIKLDDEAKRQILKEHNGIIEAIAEKDSEVAFKKMSTHILHTHEIHKRCEK